jgi:hypothetical protein
LSIASDDTLDPRSSTRSILPKPEGAKSLNAGIKAIRSLSGHVSLLKVDRVAWTARKMSVDALTVHPMKGVNCEFSFATIVAACRK